jgi:hypothetical protein
MGVTENTGNLKISGAYETNFIDFETVEFYNGGKDKASFKLLKNEVGKYYTETIE